MPKISGKAVAIGLLLAGGAGMAAKAQETKPVDRETARQYAIIRNGVGILKYCQSRGHLTADMANEAIAVFESVLPPLYPWLTAKQKTAGDKAQRDGEKGKIGIERANFAKRAKFMETTPAALCQDTHDKIMAAAAPLPSQEAYELVRNQIGVMHYCREKGHITATRAGEAIAFFRSMIHRLPPGQSPEAAAASGDAAEKEGAAGKWGLSPRIDIGGTVPLTIAARICRNMSSGFGGQGR